MLYRQANYFSPEECRPQKDGGPSPPPGSAAELCAGGMWEPVFSLWGCPSPVRAEPRLGDQILPNGLRTTAEAQPNPPALLGGSFRQQCLGTLIFFLNALPGYFPHRMKEHGLLAEAQRAPD